jgi:uncharacterized membrane protein YeiH
MEHWAVAVAAVSGVLAGQGKRVDLFGVLVLALVTAFGGGTLRDLLLGDVPVIWMREPHLLTTASSAAFATFIAARYFHPPVYTLLVADAFALALFTMIGTKKALAWGVAPSIAVTLGVITGVAGGIIRDVLTGEIPLVFRPQIYLYATAALVGAVVFVLVAGSGHQPQAALLTGAAATLSLRLAAIRWKLNLPEFRGQITTTMRDE